MQVQGNESEIQTPNFHRDSCQPCSSTMVPSDSESEIENIEITYDDDQFGYYYATPTVNRPGTYSVMAAGMQNGGFRVLIYRQPDFTNFVAE